MNEDLTYELVIRQQDLVDNPTARVPVCLCLDTSGSMEGEPISELNKGVAKFYEAIRNDEMAYYTAEICIVTFGGKEKCISDFSSLSIKPETPILNAEGRTPMGEAVNLALDLLEKRKQEYKDSGVDYYQPWLVLMTDGIPCGDEKELECAKKRTSELVNGRKLSIFPIGVGERADLNVLKNFSPRRSPIKLKNLRFEEFFEWLGQSISVVSQSSPGDEIKLDYDGIYGWGEL